MSILDNIQYREKWKEFLQYKQENRHLSKGEEESINKFIEKKRFIYYYEQICKEEFPSSYPIKKIVNKEGTNKKRVVYSFEEEENLVLKFIAHELWRFDDVLCKNCYSFRRGYGVKDAIRQFRYNPKFSNLYCFKADISNYFNSISIELLLKKLDFLKHRDEKLYRLFERILKLEQVWENGVLIKDCHGAMAGTPISPFFANVFLKDVDSWFFKKNIPYYRYSDDILIFAENEKQLEEHMKYFYELIENHKLTINPAKVTLSKPGEPWEFLGFSYEHGKLDLSENTKRKTKAKIKRKAEALRRWQRKKGLATDKAAIGFIRAMNRKFYGSEDTDDFTWNRWFFPNITEDSGLKEIDAYMQQYIRYTVTGRHYKGNYRISYEQLKKWGYRSLVHEYYKFLTEKKKPMSLF